MRQRDYTYQIVFKDKTGFGGTSFDTGPWNKYLADDRNRWSRIGI
jgi:hypothetical protein